MENILILVEDLFRLESPKGLEYVFSSSQSQKTKDAIKAFSDKTGYDPEKIEFKLFKIYEPELDDKSKNIIASFGKPTHVLKVKYDGAETDEYIVATRPGFFKHIGGQTQTGAIHELATGVLIARPEAKLKTFTAFKTQVLEVFDNVNDKHLPTYRLAFKDHIIEDARKIAQAFLKKADPGKVKKVTWIGPKNATTGSIDMEVGPADIVVHADKDVPISIKMGKGQLKNPSPKRVVAIVKSEYKDALEKLEDKRFLGLIDSLYKREMTNLVNAYMSLFAGTEAYENNKEKLQGIKDWASYSVFLKKEPALALRLSGLVSADKDRHKAWRTAKTRYLVSAISDLMGKALNSAEKNELTPKLRALYEEMFTIIDKPYYYLGEGGKKVLRVPSKKEFAILAREINFSHTFSDQGAFFVFTVVVGERVGEKVEHKDLLAIPLNFRWHKGQMLTDLAVKVRSPEFLIGYDEVVKFLFPDTVVVEEHMREAYDMISRMKLLNPGII